MNFVPADGSDEQDSILAGLDTLVQHLVHQDMRGRQAAYDGDMETGQEVAMDIGMILSGLTWGQMPTVIMHMANHIGTARMDAGRMAGTCEAAADGLTKVSQVLSEAGAPLNLCAQLMDLAVELRTSAQECLFEPSGCDDEGTECVHG